MSTTVSWHGDEWLARVGIPAATVAVNHAAAVGSQLVRDSLGTDHGGTPSRPFNPPNTQTNQLRRSIQFAKVEQTGKPLTAQVGTSTRYARVLEFGGTIRAKGKKLLVPLNREAAKALKRVGGNPRALHLRLIPRPGKPPLLVSWDNYGKRSRGSRKAKSAGGGEQMRPMFILLTSVTIAPRPFLRPLVNNPDNQQRLRAAIRTVFAAEVAKAQPGRNAA